MLDPAAQMRDFLQFVAVQLIDHPEKAQLRMAEVEKDHYRFRLIVEKEDVAILIGKNGFTASTLRSLLKAAAEKHQVQVSLQIHSHEEEEQRLQSSS